MKVIDISLANPIKARKKIEKLLEFDICIYAMTLCNSHVLVTGVEDGLDDDRWILGYSNNERWLELIEIDHIYYTVTRKDKEPADIERDEYFSQFNCLRGLICY